MVDLSSNIAGLLKNEQIQTHTKGRRPCGEGSREWSGAPAKLRNTEDS